MRRILFWLMIVLVIFLAIVLGIAAKQKTSPKAVLQSWMGKDTTVVTTDVVVTTGMQMTGTTEELSGGLSDKDRADTQNFMDSLGTR